MHFSKVIYCLVSFGYQAQSLRLSSQDQMTSGINLKASGGMSMWNYGWKPLETLPGLNITFETSRTSDADDVCEKRSNSREFEDNVDIPTAGQCELAVINAGMPRTASTLIGHIIQDAVHHVHKHAKIYSTYWNFHHHIGVHHTHSQAKRYVASAKAAISSMGAKGILIAKAHEFYEPLLSACKNSIVFTTHRHPLDEMNSAVGAGWVPQQSEASEAVIGLYKNWIADQQCWINKASVLNKSVVDFDFENDIASGEVGALAALALEAVASALTDSKPHALQKFVAHEQQRWGQREANGGIPSKRDHATCSIPHANPKNCLKPSVSDAADELLKASMHYGYTI